MTNDLVASKIELLQEQIENLQQSGYFTEKEMDKLSFPLHQELKELQTQVIEVIDAEIVTPNHQEA